MNPIDNPYEDTEFNDALRKHGILPALPEAPRTPSPPPSPRLAELLSGASPAALDDLAEDEHDSETERVIQAYRRQRLNEIKGQQQRSRFGTVIPIGRDDYSREVSEASKVDDEEEGSGTGVICFLYKDGHPPSTRLADHLRQLAAKYPRTKFVSIIGNKCIENYPDRLLPTMLMYRAGEIVHKVSSWGMDRNRYVEELEALLMASLVIIPSQAVLGGTSSLAKTSTSKTSRNSEDEDEDSGEELKSAWRDKDRRGEKKPVKKNIRSATVEDDNSDFDL